MTVMIGLMIAVRLISIAHPTAIVSPVIVIVIGDGGLTIKDLAGNVNGQRICE